MIVIPFASPRSIDRFFAAHYANRKWWVVVIVVVVMFGCYCWCIGVLVPVLVIVMM